MTEKEIYEYHNEIMSTAYAMLMRIDKTCTLAEQLKAMAQERGGAIILHTLVQCAVDMHDERFNSDNLTIEENEN